MITMEDVRRMLAKTTVNAALASRLTTKLVEMEDTLEQDISEPNRHPDENRLKSISKEIDYLMTAIDQVNKL